MFSIVIPTYNNSQTLGATIESLLVQQSSFPYEIIVVDNASTDDTAALIGAYADRAIPEVRYVLERTPGISAARNAGIAVARGDVIAFTDDDCLPHPDWLAALADAYDAHPDAWAVGGRIVLVMPSDCPAWFRLASPRYDMKRFLASLDLGEGLVKLEYPAACWGANLSVRTQVFSRVGLFNTALGVTKSDRLVGEDLEFCHRIHRSGGTIYYSGRAAMRHTVRGSRITKRNFRRGAYWGGLTEGHPSIRARLSIRESSREALVLAKDCAKMFACYAIGRSARAFQYELAVRKRIAYLWQGWLRQTFTS